jgi:hypothetical protein
MLEFNERINAVYIIWVRLIYSFGYWSIMIDTYVYYHKYSQNIISKIHQLI